VGSCKTNPCPTCQQQSNVLWQKEGNIWQSRFWSVVAARPKTKHRIPSDYSHELQELTGKRTECPCRRVKNGQGH
jgi:hypothetical protein